MSAAPLSLYAPCANAPPITHNTPQILQFSNSPPPSVPSCNICYNEEFVDIVFLPCFHHLCYDCLSKLNKSVCPWCRFNFSTELNRETVSGTSAQHSHHTHHPNDNDDYSIDTSTILLEQQLFRIENRQQRRQQQQQRRHRNKQRPPRPPPDDEFYNFFLIFNPYVNPSHKHSNHRQQSENNPKNATPRKVNHRLNRYPDSRQSILQIR